MTATATPPDREDQNLINGTNPMDPRNEPWVHHRSTRTRPLQDHRGCRTVRWGSPGPPRGLSQPGAHSKSAGETLPAPSTHGWPYRSGAASRLPPGRAVAVTASTQDCPAW